MELICEGLRQVNEQELLNALPGAVFVCDTKTHELVYRNQAAQELLLKDGFLGATLKLNGQAAFSCKRACGDCGPNREMIRGEGGVLYQVTRRKLDWNGRACRVISADRLSAPLLDKEDHPNIQAEEALSECVAILTGDGSLEHAVGQVLEKLCGFYAADGAYVFEYADGGKSLRSTFSWRRNQTGVQKEKEFQMDEDRLAQWSQSASHDVMMVESLEELKDSSPYAYEYLRSQGVTSAAAVPLWADGNLMGLLGLDNPARFDRGTFFLSSLVCFVAEEICKRRLEKQLQFLRCHDTLTGLYNRSRYIETLEALDLSQVHSLGVAFVDINGLKDINDSYGYHYGDSFVIGVGAVLREHFGEETVYRISGDEFVLLCVNMTLRDFLDKLDRIHADFQSIRSYSVSIGQTWSDKEFNVEELTMRAAELMYRDKHDSSQALLTRQDWPAVSSKAKIIQPLAPNSLAIAGMNSMDSFLTDLPGWKKRMAQYDAVTRQYFDEIYEIDLTRNTMGLVYKIDNKLVSYPFHRPLKEAFAYVCGSLAHPDDRENFLRTFCECLLPGRLAREKGIMTLKYRHLGQDGTYYWVEAAIMRISYPDRVEGSSSATALLLVKNIHSSVVAKSQIRTTENKYYLALKMTCGYICDVNIINDTYRLSVSSGCYLGGIQPDGRYNKQTSWLADHMVHPDDRQLWLDHMLLGNLLKKFSARCQTISLDYRLRDLDGSYHWMNNLAVYLKGESGHPDSILIIAHDIETQRQAEDLKLKNSLLRQEVDYQRQMNKKDARYRIIVEQTRAGVFEWNRDPDALEIPLKGVSLGSVYVSDSLVEKFQYRPDDGDFIQYIISHEYVHPDDLERFQNFLLQNQFRPSWETVFRLKDGNEYHWNKVTLTTVFGKSGRRERIIGTVLDVHQETEAKNKLRKRLEQDALTGLLNQESFYQKADQVLKQYPERTYAVIMMDIDKFKIINDVYGMEGGNKALSNIGKVLTGMLSPKELCARMYADVFFILAEYQTNGDILRLIQKITVTLGKLGYEPALHPSFGICKTDHDNSAVSLCEMAGFAHKSIKSSIFNHWMFYNDAIRLNILAEKQMETEMEAALKNRQFHVYLQPKHSLDTGEVVGAEALVRWIHPVKGLIPPGQFIPLFEKNGFILKLEPYLWEEVCKNLKKWKDEGKKLVPISVNVSRLHLYNPGLQDIICGLADQYGIPRSFLELELTESMFFEDMSNLSRVLNQLKVEGFTLDMDDFGSGYSSLNMLKNIPIDVLKIDREFFNETVATDKGKTVIKYTVAMAHELSMSVVAEGVETEVQAKFLLDVGCHVAQGFYFSKPMPTEEFERVCWKESEGRESTSIA